jgi:hypothetical protein
MPISSDNEGSPPTSSKTVKPTAGKTNPIRPNTRNETKKTGTTTPLTKDNVHGPSDGRQYLEKFLLLCPAGEPVTNVSMSNCLHQISEIKGIPNKIFNAVQAAAFLVGEMEENTIHEVVREAVVSQINELAQDLKDLIEDAKDKINNHVQLKISEIALPQPTSHPASPPPLLHPRHRCPPPHVAHMLTPCSIHPRTQTRN